MYTVLRLTTAQRIAIAARGLLDKEGCDAVTMRRVAECVGITAMAVYKHYANRDDLLNTLAEEGFSELAHLLAQKRRSKNTEDRLMKMFEVYLDHALRNPRLFELMFLSPRLGARRYPKDFKAGQSPTASIVARVAQEGIDRDELRDGDAWEIVFAMGALSHGLILLYLGGRINMTASGFRVLYRQSFRRYFDGIRKQC